jgi:hypothetical protein
MMIHPDLMLTIAKDHHRELIAQGDRARLLSRAHTARRWRKVRAARGQPAGTLASCEPSAVVPAR